MPLYDYLIVGSGLFGATVAHELLKHGKRCLVVEKRGHVGGNIFTKELEENEKQLQELLQKLQELGESL